MYTEDERMEKFGVVDQETGEMVIDRVSEKKDFIEQGVRLLHEMDSLKDSMKELLEDAKDKEYDKKNLKQLIDNAYKNEIEMKIQELKGIQEELDKLFGE